MCHVEHCDLPAVAKGYCRKHYMRLRRHGDARHINKAGRPKLPTPGSPEAIEGMLYSLAEIAKPSGRTFARYQRALRLIHETAILTGEDPGDLHDRALNTLAETGGKRSITPKGLEDYALSRLRIAKILQELRPIPKSDSKQPETQTKLRRVKQPAVRRQRKDQPDLFQN